jgi:hypothetical protein
MSLLFDVVYAANATGTHHKLALDALRYLDGPSAEGWRRLFLKHAALYVQGAKVPDDEFKDFKNHVLHVRDGYWGGAADKADSWYGQLVRALAEARWSEAVWAAGVLSHYYTDPIQPFHTAQSEAENNIHRAAEWSISKSYDELRKLGVADFGEDEVSAGTGAGWLRELVLAGAERSNQHYERLIAHYDIHRGVVDPPTGLDVVSRRLVSELVVYAARSFAIVLDRAFAEARIAPPAVNLTLDAVLATLKIPVKRLLARMADKEERRLVERMYDELKTTGRVEANLPADDRMVRELYAKEVLAPQLAARAADRARMIAAPSGAQQPPARAVPAIAPAAPASNVSANAASATVDTTPIAPQSGLMAKLVSVSREDAARKDGPVPNSGPAPSARLAEMSPRPQAQITRPAEITDIAAEAGPASAPRPAATVPSIVPVDFAARSDRSARTFLAAGDDVERAPSIGPKTAERLYAIGIKTVSDFLAAEPEATAASLEVRHISAHTIIDWQDQSRLVMAVPGLRGTHAQLLVGAGYRTASALAGADGNDLLVAVLEFVGTSEGQRVLRDGSPPDLEKIMGWIAGASTRVA